MTALTNGLIASMRAMQASSSSTGESSPCADQATQLDGGWRRVTLVVGRVSAAQSALMLARCAMARMQRQLASRSAPRPRRHSRKRGSSPAATSLSRTSGSAMVSASAFSSCALASAGRPRGATTASQVSGVEAGIAAFGQRRHLGQQRPSAWRVVTAMALILPVLSCGMRRRHGVDGERHLAADQVGHGRRAALVRHVQQLRCRSACTAARRRNARWCRLPNEP